MAKKIEFNQQARESIRRGVNQLTAAVKVTLGPTGRVVVIEKSFGAPTVTKDGVTVAEEIELSDKTENMGAQLVKEAASNHDEPATGGRPIGVEATAGPSAAHEMRTSREIHPHEGRGYHRGTIGSLDDGVFTG